MQRWSAAAVRVATFFFLHALPDELEIERAEADIDHDRCGRFLGGVGDELLGETGHANQMYQESLDTGRQVVAQLDGQLLNEVDGVHGKGRTQAGDTFEDAFLHSFELTDKDSFSELAVST